MTKNEVAEKLNLLIESNNLKKSEIEKKLAMPLNSLSNFLSGKKELPDKWVAPIIEYLTDRGMLSENSEKSESTDTKMVVDAEGFKNKPKKELIDEVMAKINKDYGEGTVMNFGDKPQLGYQTISSGSLTLDVALGIGGFPRGRMIEIYGHESSGKTTIALYAIADAQRQGLTCLLVDAENSFDPEYAAILGVDIDKLKYCQPSYGEQGLEVADRYITGCMADVVVIDSVAALIPKAELEGEHGDNKMGLHARLMSQACRKLVGAVAKSNALLIFINQIRNKIGIMFGSPEVTTGGMALQFYASMRLSVSRSTSNENSIMNGSVKDGNKTTVKVVKNKCASPFRSATFYIMYGKGIDKTSEIVDLAVDLKVIDKAGSWYSYKGDKLGQGKETVVEILNNHESMAKEIENKIRAILKPEIS